jgi:asparagine synthase (glutamine-hydrolysing)
MDAFALGESASGREVHARILMLPRYQFSMEVLDGAAAPFQVEPRYPYMDRRVMEYCVAIPSDQKLLDGWPRSIQRRGMEGILPPLIQWRLQKQRLGYSFIRGMKNVEAPDVDGTLFDQEELGEFVDLDAVRDAHERVLSSDPSLEIESDTMMLYKAIVLARWLRDHGPGAS